MKSDCAYKKKRAKEPHHTRILEIERVYLSLSRAPQWLHTVHGERFCSKSLMLFHCLTARPMLISQLNEEVSRLNFQQMPLSGKTKFISGR